jgi:hypothetical protein
MSKERYLEQEINKDLKILDLERQLAEAKDLIELEIFLHSHFETGEPLEIDVLSVNGKVNLVWLYSVFDKDFMYYPDLLQEVYDEIKCTDKTVWITCKPILDIDDPWVDDIKLKERG